MSLPALDNLVRIGQLKAEPRNEAECGAMCAGSGPDRWRRKAGGIVIGTGMNEAETQRRIADLVCKRTPRGAGHYAAVTDTVPARWRPVFGRMTISMSRSSSVRKRSRRSDENRVSL